MSSHFRLFLAVEPTLGTINIYCKVFRFGDSRGASICVVFSGERFIKRLQINSLCGADSEENLGPQGKERASSQVSEKGHPTSHS